MTTTEKGHFVSKFLQEGYYKRREAQTVWDQHSISVYIKVIMHNDIIVRNFFSKKLH